MVDAAVPPLQDDSLDGVFDNGLIEHLRNPIVVVETFYRGLKIGVGRLLEPGRERDNPRTDQSNPSRHASIALRNRWQRYRHGELEAKRKLKGLPRRVGFVDLSVRTEAIHEAPAELRGYMPP